MAGKQPDWDLCSHDGCIGVQLPTTPLCLAHAAKQAPDAFGAELKRIGEEGKVDARGVVISAQLLHQFLAAAPREDDDPVLTAARFERASFHGWTSFVGVRFKGMAWFDAASFHGDAWFVGASFQDSARFSRVRFHGDAWFLKASFQREADFYGASFQYKADFGGANFNGRAAFGPMTFQHEARFGGARFKLRADFGQTKFKRLASFYGADFEGPANFDRASFHLEAGFGGTSFHSSAMFFAASFYGRAQFDGTKFEASAWFDQASFDDGARFVGASFRHDASFDRATFRRWAWFSGANFHRRVQFAQTIFQDKIGFTRASFERAAQLGPLLARHLILDDAVFSSRVQLEVTAATLCAKRARFPAGLHLRIRFASIVLDDASLVAPAILAGAPSPFPALARQEQQVARGWERLPPGPREQRWRPRLLSVCRADVAGLRLADVDLRACRFVGAHNLDRLRIEGAPLFARTGGWWRARRKTLAEEQHWRGHRQGRWRPVGWYPPVCQPPASPTVEAPEVLEPTRLAALYRDLRKGREDAKDEPGAADFYYGEMEMRRLASTTPWAEQVILFVYWLVAGYGLRGLRALAALTVVVVALAGLFHTIGFLPTHPAPSWWESLLYTAGSTLSINDDTLKLSAWGKLLRIPLRLLGPVLLGLALLSVRNRVKR